MNFSSLSIKQTFALALLIAVLLSTAIVGWIGQWTARHLVSERLETVELPNLLIRIRNEVDKEISLLQSATQQLATDDLILDWMTTGRDPEKEVLVVRYLNRLKNQYDLTNVSVADRQTAHYWNQDGFLRVLQNDKLDGWFFAFRDSGQSVSKSLYTEGETTKLFINFQNTGGRMLAGVGRSVDQMVDMLNSFKIADSGYVFLTDAAGTVKIHRNSQLLNKADMNSLFGSEAGSKLTRGSQFTMTETVIDGQKMFVASSYISSADWYIVAQVPVDEVFAELNSARNKMIFWILLVAAGFTVAGLMLAAQITKPICQLASVFSELGQADSNFEFRLAEQKSQELKDLQAGFNAFVAKIQRTVELVAQNSEELKVEADGVAQSAKATLSRGTQQAEHTGQLVTAINQMGQTVDEVAKNANQAADTANELEDSSVQGKEVSRQAKQAIESLSEQVGSVADVINELANHTNAIGTVLEVIRGVSEQTNLLALNAAIEAARAGEQGRGFAVVADEVRHLAARCTDTAERTAALISSSVEKTAHGSQVATETATALQGIVTNIDQTADLAVEIAKACKEQASGAEKISAGVDDIDQITKQNSINAKRSANVSSQLAAQAEELQELLNRFKLKH